MKKFNSFTALAIVAVLAAPSFAQTPDATVEVIDNPGAGFFDIFYTPTETGEFAAWDLLVTPTLGSLRDTDQGNRSDDVSDGAVDDTWANTVFSSFGAGPASYIFTEYNPGSAFPPVAADPLPTVGGTPDQLNWTIFDTASGDGRISGFTPYHMARVQYSTGGMGDIEIAFFEGGAEPAPGGTFTGTYGETTGGNEAPTLANSTGGTKPNRIYTADLSSFASDDSPVSELTWMIDGSVTGPNVPANQPTIDDNGLLTWNTAGLPQSFMDDYVIPIKVTDLGGLMGTGSHTVRLPEPSTMILAGFSVVGVFARRRRS